MLGVKGSNLRSLDPIWLAFILLAVLPFFDSFLPREYRIADLMRPIFIFAVLGLGLNVVTGFTGLLNLGVSGFMAIGVYTYAILTCSIYPFQLGFWTALLCAGLAGALIGALLGIPVLRLKGDYLAVVTLGFGEIIQDSLKNLEGITKGTQGINPLPPPHVFGINFVQENFLPWYYLYLLVLVLVLVLVRNLEHSRVGRSWLAIRDDELAASCMGINPVVTKLLAFAVGAGLAGFSGGLWASYLGSTGEPSNYDFQISIIALCIVIVGGLGNLSGVLLGAFVMVGFNSVLLVKLTEALGRVGIVNSSNVYTSPSNWKYLVFGLALVLMMRFFPEGILPRRSAKRETNKAGESA